MNILENSHVVSPLPKGKHIITCVTGERPFAYSHDKETGSCNPDWMSGLSDDTCMSEISIPGTHDTMAQYGGDSAQCQSVSLSDQLEAGIRFIDIRCRHITDVFAIHHGVVYQNCSFGEVLDAVSEFLNAHPTETIYMRVKEEYEPSNNTRTFEETFRDAYWNARQSLFWKPDECACHCNPKLELTRGKIVVLQDFNANEIYGVKWGTLNVQDDYVLSSNWDLYDKWEKVKKQLDNANRNKESKNIYVNFLSGSTGSFPYFVASGQSSPQTDAPRLLTGRTTPGWKDSWVDFPRVGCFCGICSIAFEGTNILAAERIGKDREFNSHVGIVVADFPARDLIDRIISLNK